jgi:hypothetical protein
MKRTSKLNYSYSVNQCFFHLQYDNQTKKKHAGDDLRRVGGPPHARDARRLHRRLVPGARTASASPCYTVHTVSARGMVLTFSAIKSTLISYLAQWYNAFVFLDPNFPEDFRHPDLNTRYTLKYALSNKNLCGLLIMESVCESDL